MHGHTGGIIDGQTCSMLGPFGPGLLVSLSTRIDCLSKAIEARHGHVSRAKPLSIMQRRAYFSFLYRICKKKKKKKQVIFEN